MTVIPAINEKTFEEVAKKIRIAEDFLPANGWIHIDVADGIFTPNKTWNVPDELASFKTRLNFEVHLMVEKPEAVIDNWLKVGVKRLIIHLEAFAEPNFILNVVKEYNAEIILAANPVTPGDAISLYLGSFDFFQVLAVDPGLAGQKFQEKVLEKIKFLRSRNPAVKIEVDGGIDLETAKIVKAAGADIIISASYIFNHPAGPATGYRELAGV
ncbi:MAG: hypothetical protein AAB772_00010 [Patescibacteria group bacterium]